MSNKQPATIMAGELRPGEQFTITPNTKRVQTMRNQQGNMAISAIDEKNGRVYLLGSHVIVWRT